MNWIFVHSLCMMLPFHGMTLGFEEFARWFWIKMLWASFLTITSNMLMAILTPNQSHDGLGEQGCEAQFEQPSKGRRCSQKLAYISDLAVSCSQRRQGIGRQLLDAAEQVQQCLQADKQQSHPLPQSRSNRS